MIKQKNFLVLFVFTVMIFVSCQQEISSSYHLSSENRTYTVTFYPNNNSSSWSISVQEGDTVSQPDNPTRKGYSFEYWYKSNSLSKFDFSSPIKNNCSLYAKWIPLKYRITYILNDGFWKDNNYKEVYSKEESFYLPNKNKIKRDGYIFMGWYENDDFTGEQITYIQKGTTGDKKFYAQWEIISYSIEYELNGGEWKHEVQNNYTINDNFILPTSDSLYRYGYTFDGWYYRDPLDNTEKRIEHIAKGTTGDKSVYAKWTKDIEAISVILESVSGDKEITFEVKNSYYLSANIAKSPYETNVVSWFWKVDGIKAQNATNVSYPYALYFGDMDAGYHNATLVITTRDGNTYSANAIFTIKK